MEVVTSWRRLMVLCMAIGLPACTEAVPAGSQEPYQGEEVVKVAERAPLHPYGAHEDGCEMVLHPCSWEESCTAPCRGAMGSCCQGHWVCPAGIGPLASRQPLKAQEPIGHGTRAPRKAPLGGVRGGGR